MMRMNAKNGQDIHIGLSVLLFNLLRPDDLRDCGSYYPTHSSVALLTNLCTATCNHVYIIRFSLKFTERSAAETKSTQNCCEPN